jgi:hypothetical protein
LTPNVVDTITFGENYNAVEVLNRNGAGELYFTVDGTLVPTVGGSSNHVLPAAVSAMTVNAGGTVGPTIVRVISSAAATYSVRAA